MPGFQPHTFDRVALQQEVQELQDLLDHSNDISEKQFHSFFEPRSHLRGWIGMRNSDLATPDLLAWEFPLFGDFRCDFVVGDSDQKAFTFVEYEDAGPKSLFVKQGKKATRVWSPRFESGYSQIIDWFYKLHAMTNTPDMEAQFGKRSIRYTGLLVVGRNQYMTAGEAMRMEWRRDHVVVNSKHIVCLTYDQLVQDLLFRLERAIAPESTRS
jgi:hypothetical protein